MKKLTTMMMVVALVFGIGASIVSAEIVDVVEVMRPPYGRVLADGTPGIVEEWPLIGSWSGVNECQLWMKFQIPTHAEAPTIESAILTINIYAQLHALAHAGVVADHAPDDSWDETDIHSGWPIADSRTIANPSDSGGVLGEFSIDITDWLNEPGEGQGETLSIKLFRIGGGWRGCYLAPSPQLTVTSVPEPASLCLLGLGSFVLCRKRK